MVTTNPSTKDPEKGTAKRCLYGCVLGGHADHGLGVAYDSRWHGRHIMHALQRTGNFFKDTLVVALRRAEDIFQLSITTSTAKLRKEC